MKRLYLALILLVLATWPAHAQSPVTVIGPITPGDCTAFSSTTIIKDAGSPCGGAGTALVVGTTTITGGTSPQLLNDNAGVLGQVATGTGGHVIPFLDGNNTYSGTATFDGGGFSLILGSDATGDIYYRNSGGTLSRLGIGTPGQVIEVVGGLPAYATITGTGTVTGPVSSTNNAIATWNGTDGIALLNTLDTISPAGTIAISPTANSYSQGLNITQSSPTSGSQAGPFSYNLIAITDESDITGSPGTVQTSGLRINMTVGGANLAGQPKIGAYFNMVESISGVTSAADKIGAVGSCLIQIVEAATGAGCYGLNSSAQVQSNGSINRLVGMEADIGIASGSAANYRYGYSVVNTGVVQASTLDAAFVVGNISSTAGSFKGLVELSNSFGFAPMTTTASLFSSDTTATVANIFQMPNVTVTNNILNFPAVSLTGGGVMVLGAGGIGSGSITFNGGTSGSFVLGASGAGFPTITNLVNSVGTDPMCWSTSDNIIRWATACTASDERLKTNFAPAPGLSAVMCMNGVKFDWKDADQARRKGRQIGLIAQDVQKCLPEVVSDNGEITITFADGTTQTIEHTLIIDYPRLTAVLINALHETQKEIEGLKQRKAR